MKFSFFKIAALLFFFIPVFSCSVVSELGHSRFIFHKDQKEKKLVFRLPKGKKEEKFRVGEKDAKEQFYYYGDGSVFYVARHTTWQTVNTFRIDALTINAKERSSAFSGKGNDGLYWKEIQFDDFKIGYAYVTAGRLERFNDALNSVKIR